MVLSSLTHKKGQIWGFDLVIAITIFMVGIIAAYLYAINFLGESQEILDSLFYDGNLASSLILSEGTPEDWTIDNVEIPGILSGEKINQTKLDNFYSLNYSMQKKLLGTQYEFYFNFTDMEANGVSVEGIGLSPSEPKNLVKIERFTVYKNKPIKFILFMWN
jgi:hypothetical protein